MMSLLFSFYWHLTKLRSFPGIFVATLNMILLAALMQDWKTKALPKDSIMHSLKP